MEIVEELWSSLVVDTLMLSCSHFILQHLLRNKNSPIFRMPRLPTRDIIKAYRLHKLLPLLLKECRSIDSAQNELRWLSEAVKDKKSKLQHMWPKLYRIPCQTILRSMCRARSKGIPLQYILGDQPFGDLEILCERGVLIPRPETEAHTFFIGNLLVSNISCGSPHSARPLRIMDICTGTGCISLLLHAILSPHFQRLSILGIDLSSTAIRLANKNIEHNIQRGLLSDRSRTEVGFCQGDLFTGGRRKVPGIEEILKSYAFSPICGEKLEPNEHVEWDVLVSNPPYISPQSYQDGPTSRSVRHFEPRIALVPPTEPMLDIPGACRQEDIFYYRLIALSFKLSVRLTVLECGDREQGSRVADICNIFADSLHQDNDWNISIWPDVETGYDGRFGEACAVVLHKRF